MVCMNYENYFQIIKQRVRPCYCVKSNDNIIINWFIFCKIRKIKKKSKKIGQRLPPVSII